MNMRLRKAPSSLVQKRQGAWLVVMMMGVLGRSCGFLYLAGTCVGAPSKICLAFSAHSGLISGSSQMPMALPHRPSKQKICPLTHSPQLTTCLSPRMKAVFPVLLGPHSTMVLRFSLFLLIHAYMVASKLSMSRP